MNIGLSNKMRNSIKLTLISLMTLIIGLGTPTFTQALELHGHFNVGVAKTTGLVPTLSGGLKSELKVVTNLGLEVRPLHFWSGYLNVFGNIETWSTPLSVKGYSPFRDIYTIGASVQFKNGMYFRVEHFCSHPVNSNQSTLFRNANSVMGTFNKFSVGIVW